MSRFNDSEVINEATFFASFSVGAERTGCERAFLFWVGFSPIAFPRYLFPPPAVWVGIHICNALKMARKRAVDGGNWCECSTDSTVFLFMIALQVPGIPCRKSEQYIRTQATVGHNKTENNFELKKKLLKLNKSEIFMLPA